MGFQIGQGVRHLKIQVKSQYKSYQTYVVQILSNFIFTSPRISCLKLPPRFVTMPWVGHYLPPPFYISQIYTQVHV